MEKTIEEIPSDMEQGNEAAPTQQITLQAIAEMLKNMEDRINNKIQQDKEIKEQQEAENETANRARINRMEAEVDRISQRTQNAIQEWGPRAAELNFVQEHRPPISSMQSIERGEMPRRTNIQCILSEF